MTAHHDTMTVTKEDRAAWSRLARAIGHRGRAEIVQNATSVRIDGPLPLLVVIAASGAEVSNAAAMLRVEPGEIAELIDGFLDPGPAGDDRTYLPPVITFPRDIPTWPLEPGEVGTVFPDDDEDDDEPSPPAAMWVPGYAGRRRLPLTRLMPVEAAALATLVPGIRGIIMFCAARGDSRSMIAETLHIDPIQVDGIIDGPDGCHLERTAS